LFEKDFDAQPDGGRFVFKHVIYIRGWRRYRKAGG
jgi:hypothetical protein